MSKLEQDKWDGYFYPGTETLVNLPGITDLDTLTAWTRACTAARAVQLYHQPPHELSPSKLLMAVHYELFRDSFSWAGTLRDVNIMKNNSWNPNNPTLFLSYESIPRYLDYIDTFASSYSWEGLSFDDKVHQLATIHAHLDYAHPFREGNGRALRLAMEFLAQRYGVEIRWGKISKELHLLATSAVFFTGDVNPEPAIALYREITTAL
ncbi:Fic family protein [Corynebacterium sp. ES2794-CONJ1]|uniref:Fic/DOC family protein n=1 Tax=unclassified Corynebacterium TaxID=2624378 RepID=UPI002168F8CD|nr:MULTISPECIES: Fic family protein [unclassified Corynebacterium]MCS4490141.1 Fic family protein [Corynebacterium sp. ES2775-CONJ]MCS4492050.1 Fic family protein [Corynebacterium sp. ES2715-CONJ3]MCS4532158.1 Fic family protein [Corynebacterium sp. ES2730-CONJ]MCU9519554.1 Fic family protein [Corynebacterium sp. ES2794-CONJ1]